MSSIYDALKRVQHEDAKILPPAGKPKTWNTPKNWVIVIIAVTVSSLVSMGIYSHFSTPHSSKNTQNVIKKIPSQSTAKAMTLQKKEPLNIPAKPAVAAVAEDPVASAPEKSKDEYVKLAKLYFEKGEFDKAASVYREALGVYKYDAGLINNLGAVLLAKSDYDSAIRYFKIAIQCSKDNVEPVYNLACAYAKKGDKISALKELERAIKMNGQDVRKWAKNDPDLESLKGAWNKRDDNH
jgi:tetratricopeptide (TPR) repeat protein